MRKIRHLFEVRPEPARELTTAVPTPAASTFCSRAEPPALPFCSRAEPPASTGSSESYKHKLRDLYWGALAHFESDPDAAIVLYRTTDANALTVRLTHLIAEGRELGVLTDEVSERVLLDFFLGALWRFVDVSAERCTSESSRQASASFELLWRAMARPVQAHPDQAAQNSSM